MKKLLYFFTFIFSFLILNKSVFAYSSQIKLNYDNFDLVLQSNPKYQQIIDGIRSRLDDTNLKYYIFVVGNNTTGSCGFSGPANQNNYNIYCAPSYAEEHGGYFVRLRIFNPLYYQSDGSVQDLYFGISGGSPGGRAFIGPSPATYYSDSVVTVDPTANFEQYQYLFTFSNVDDLSNLDIWLNSPTYNNTGSTYNSVGTSGSADEGLFYANYIPFYVYSNIKIPYKYFRYHHSVDNVTSIKAQNNLLIEKNNEVITTQIDDDAIWYYTEDSFDVIDVEDFGNNSYGFYNNLLSISNYIDLNGSILTNSITCIDKSRYPDEEDYKDFNNGYCMFEKEDFGSFSNSQILDSKFMFFDLTGHIDYLLQNNKYYAYNFRLIKPFTPKVEHLSLTLNNSSSPYPVNIDKVYKHDGGSYIDYVIVFYYEGATGSILNNINVGFANPISFYQSSVGYDFVFGVYRSFKLSYYDTKPSDNEISSFYTTNDLSSIDGVNNSTSFFDTTFDTYGFAGIVTAPFRLLYAILDMEDCSAINLPFPHTNKNITLACVRSSIPASINPLIVVLQTILSGFICYRVAVGTLKVIKDALDPENANIEVVEL